MSHPKALLEKLGANALKRFSQNFLVSPHWAQTLVLAALEGEAPEEVWEIGPGLGALTRVLLGRAPCPVRAFEIDRKLAAFLRTEFPSLTLNEGDVLEAPFDRIAPGARLVVLSNLPYHLSSPILFKLAEQKHRLLRLVLTFQREFAGRLLASPGSDNYGALSVMAGFHFRVENLGILPPGAFYPPPSVDSQALRLMPRHWPGISETGLREVVRHSFAHPRKKLVSNVKALAPSLDIGALLEKMGFPPTVRPGSLSLDHYVELAKALGAC